MRASDLSAKLGSVAGSVAEYLLPNGKRQGSEWCVGGVSGEAGESLKVRMTGAKAGVFCDFATGQAGDLLDLWCAARGVGLADAIAQAKEYLGIREAKVENPKRAYAKPSREDVTKPLPQVCEWLTVVRKISAETIAAFKLATKKGALMFPYLRDGQLIAAKYRKIPAKEFYVDADCEPCLFGWQAMPAHARSVIICEGEIDALSFREYGLPALSVPFGGGKGDKQAKWIAAEFDRLAHFDAIFLAMDQDGEGRAATAEIISRLGRERCRVVVLPFKDCNECLCNGVTKETILQAIADARTVDPEQLRNAGEYEDDLVREFEDCETAEVGIRLPWKKIDDRLILRMGEVSILAGYNGHGKSELAGNMLCGAMRDGWESCVASMEFKPVKWLKRLTRQVTALRTPSKAFIRHVANWYRERLWVFDVTGKAKTDTIIEVFIYAAKRYRVKFFVIDNLAKCGFGEDDYNGQKGFVEALTDFAKNHDVHVCLVHHMRKTDAENKPGGKMDIKGTGGITDMADTVLTIWRNKPKEAAMRKKEMPPDEYVEQEKKPDAILQCHKQRNGEEEPTALLWFNRDSHQFMGKLDDKPRAFTGLNVVPHESDEVPI